MSDPRFAENPSARLNFFYDHSPWKAGNRVGEYPVRRLTRLDSLPLDK